MYAVLFLLLLSSSLLRGLERERLTVEDPSRVPLTISHEKSTLSEQHPHSTTSRVDARTTLRLGSLLP